ncbi:putative nucleotidyltransferase substrate binding domain-containing protein [Variovorax sp. J31P207]|uniref:putative nucleotidyltransferase substrate binding domain-containing protein n=1 Tax=Variovorax sp. J31P207 TaxID=3053510 RepID=UPI0025775CCF|nr:putative nucleotidyltransferase substrate binding domain-containing protein [Variovorax sp. J31P207]MDM0065697.1 putative nucleotidyltransferase substrate binding domain-containing protein [Variovorax sp. J31P207]
MPSAFDFEHSPFDCLTAEERERVRAQVDIAYFREGEAILEAGMAPTHLFVVIKGFVQQFEHGGSEAVASFGPHDTFDGRSLLSGQVGGRFVAAEEVLAYQLARQVVTELIARNATFGALLFSDLSNKLAAIAGRVGQHELQSLALARVDAIPVRAPHFVDADRDVLSVVRLLQAERSTNVLVRDLSGPAPRLGIFTVTALQRAVLHGTPLDRLPVREVSSFGLITVDAAAPVGDALIVMVRHRVHRVVVTAGDGGGDGGRVVGVLEALDLFSFLSNHSYLINREIVEAQDLQALARASAHVTQLVGLLHGGGTRVGQIATLVQALNGQLFQRAWELIAPPELVANSCLFVMGSEGRGEQLQKTDQDNGLLLRDGYVPPADLDAICQRLTRALIEFGWPECPGAIMVSNPQWRAGQAEFAERACQWLLQPDGERLMALAIFLDAHAVAGDATLLAGVRARLFSLATDNDAMLARFAAAIDAFAEDSHWWQRLLAFGEPAAPHLDVKKQGLFPIVHGVRSLALRAGLDATSTAERLEALVAAGRIEREFAADLLESLYFFMGLRLKAGLAEQAAGHDVSGQVDPARMSSLERDLLKDTLEVVKRFRRMLRLSFRLDAL